MYLLARDEHANTNETMRLANAVRPLWPRFLARHPLGREFDQVVHAGLSLRHGLAAFEAEQKLLQIVSNGKAAGLQ